MKIKDLTNQTFKFLYVVSFDSINKHGAAMWKCLCVCGKSTIVHGGALRRNEIKSCGCKRNNRPVLEKGLAAQKRLYSNYKKSAKQRDIEFNLDFQTFVNLCCSNCWYCSYPPLQTVSKNYLKFNGDFLYNGLDRKDNKIGYEKYNVVACCKTCNYAKNKYFSYEEFLLILNNRREADLSLDPWWEFRDKTK